jgi:hypothetical protein
LSRPAAADMLHGPCGDPLTFGESPLARGFDTFRNSTHRNGPMGSFGATDSRRSRPVTRPILPSLPMGSFGKRPLTRTWLRSGKAHSPGASTLFGTQHIVTGQWVRLAQPIHGRCRPFTRPILPSQPLASFGNTAVGFVRGTLPTRLKLRASNFTHSPGSLPHPHPLPEREGTGFSPSPSGRGPG